MLWKLSRAGQSKTNACRNLHQLIDTNNVLYPVPIDCQLIRVAFRKPEYRTEEMWWPMLRMEGWVQCLLKRTPKVLLGGHSLQDSAGWKRTLSQFWAFFKLVNPGHCIFTDGNDYDVTTAIPFFLHGDEGRGYCRRPFMVESFQPVISAKGLEKTNESG